MKHCTRALTFILSEYFIDHSILFALRGILVFLLTATKYCFPLLSLTLVIFCLIFSCDAAERKPKKMEKNGIHFIAYWWWMEKLNGKVPRKRFSKDLMPKTGNGFHSKPQQKESKLFFFCCRDFSLRDSVLRDFCFSASLLSVVGFGIETLLRFCIHIWRDGFYDLIRCAHANAMQSRKDELNVCY